MRINIRIMEAAQNSSVDQAVENVFALYEKFGAADYIGEPVSQLEHMSQAADLAAKEGYDDAVVLAAFFHDIGHICVMQTKANSMEGYGVKSHERIGADFLREQGFPETVARLVENHVQAKRYLTFKKPEYYQQLSDASRKTLAFQGGVMGAAEAARFEADPLFELSIRMRYWDEQAKETGVPITNMAQMKARARQVLLAAAP